MLQKLEHHAHRQPPVGRVRQWAANIGLAVAVGVVFFLAAQLGLALLTTAERVAVFWPASGIAAGTLIALGPRARAPVAAGVIVASIAANIMGDRSFWSALAFGLCNAGEALLAAWLIERWFGRAFNLDNLRRVLGFIVAAVFATATAAAAAAVAMRLLGPSTAELLDIWQVWFPSGALGIITVAPLLIGVAAAVRDPPPWHEFLEGTVAVVVVAVINGVALTLFAGRWALIAPASFLFPLLLWLGSRCRPVFAGVAVFTICVPIVWTTTHEFGRYGDASQAIADRILAAQVAMLGITLATLALAALFAERRQHLASIVEGNLQLALAGRAALVGSFAYDIDTEEIQISEGYAAIHGFSERTTHITRRTWQMAVHPEDLERVEELRNRVFRDRRREYGTEYRIVCSEAEVRWIEARCFVSYRSDGRPQRMVGVNIDVTERKRAEDHQRTLAAELDHRVKNVLAAVSAVAARTLDTSSSMEQFVAALDGRIRSMATTHELLSGRRWKGIPLAELLLHQLTPYATSNNMNVDGPDVLLSADASQTVGMALHELITNAAKYGALSVRDGQISVRWYWSLNGKVPDRLVMEWREVGGPIVRAPDRSGHGTEVIRNLIAYELDGNVDLAYPSEGVRCRFDIPLSQLTYCDGLGVGFNWSDSAQTVHDSPSKANVLVS